MQREPPRANPSPNPNPNPSPNPNPNPNQVRLYSENHLVAKLQMGEPLTAMRFGSYGREESALITVGELPLTLALTLTRILALTLALAPALALVP